MALIYRFILQPLFLVTESSYVDVFIAVEMVWILLGNKNNPRYKKN